MLSRDEFRRGVTTDFDIRGTWKNYRMTRRNGDNMINWNEFLIFVQNQHDPTEDSRVVSELLSYHDENRNETVENNGVLVMGSGDDGGKFLFG